MSTMTLEQVRDLLDTPLATQVGSRVTIHATRARQARDALDAHLAQPAQAVDVGRLHNLIGQYWDLAYAEGKEGRDTDTHTGEAQRTWQAIEAGIRALTGEKAGPVGEGVCDERKEYPDGSGYLQVAFADGVPELLGRSVRVSPASPAPDKEG